MHAGQELGGWESAEMVRRYAHLAAEHLSEYADRLTHPRAIGGTKLAHQRHGKELKEL